MRNHIKHRSIYSSARESIPDQLIVRVWKGCNFRCIFCNVAENEKTLSNRSSVREILATTLYRLKYTNFTSGSVAVTISWGEPSIFKTEVLFMLKYLREYFSKRDIFPIFDVQTNASNIDAAFAKSLRDNGVSQALVSFHAHDAEIYEKITGVSHALMFHRVVSGIEHLHNAGISVSFNSILSKLNTGHYFDHIQFLAKTFPYVELFNIGFVQPHGMANQNYDQLIFPYSEAREEYNRVIAFLKWNGKRTHSHLVGLPICHLDDYSTSMEYQHNKNIVREGIATQTLIQSINDTNKEKSQECRFCAMKMVCSGVWREFIGKQPLLPIYARQFFESPRERWVLSVSSASPKIIRQLRDSGCNQVIFDVNAAPWEAVAESISCAKKMGFSTISVYCKTLHGIEDFESFRSVSFQVPESGVDADVIASFKKNNSALPFQFRTYLDIEYEGGLKVGVDSLLHEVLREDFITLRVPVAFSKKAKKEFQTSSGVVLYPVTHRLWK